MASDVKVIIDIAKPTGTAGFGFPLILAGKETSPAEYAECYDIDEVKTHFAEGTTVYKAAQLIFTQDSPPEKVAVCGSADAATTALGGIWQNGFRQIIVTSIGAEGEDSLQDIAEYVESKGDKMLFVTVKDLSEVASLTTQDHTVAFQYYEGDSAKPEAVAALAGYVAGKAPGSLTYKNLMLKGLNPLPLSDSQIVAATEKNVITFVTKAGDSVTTEGKVLSGEYADIIDAKDYIIQQIEYQTQRLLNTSDKVPYDNNGIAMLESVCVNVLQDAYNNGMIADDEDGLPNYSVNYAPREETDENDRVVRKYVEGSFTFALAGAIHEAEIRGTITI